MAASKKKAHSVHTYEEFEKKYFPKTVKKTEESIFDNPEGVGKKMAVATLKSFRCRLARELRS